MFEANLANADAGGQEYNPQVVCYPSGMPRVMIAYEPLEIIITPDITYIRFDQMGETRRIYTDGRDWPDEDHADFRRLFDRQMGRSGQRRAATARSKWRPAA